MGDRAQPVAVVVGVGPGLGGALCRKLAAAGFMVAGIARSTEFGRQLAREMTEAGGQMVFFACDATEPGSVETTFSRIEEELGPVHTLVYNAGSFLTKPTAKTLPMDFQGLWSRNCFGAFLCARQVIPAMLAGYGGNILLTGATASIKAAGNFAAFGSSKFALRGLAQSMARELGPKGIHVAHVVIDGLIWTPRTREMPNVTKSKCLLPEAVAETYLHLIGQERSAWTHELDIRPDMESF